MYLLILCSGWKSKFLTTTAILTFLSSWNEMMLAIAFVSGEKYKTITLGVNDMVGKYETFHLYFVR